MSLTSGEALAESTLSEYQIPLDAHTRTLLTESAPLSEQWSKECAPKQKGGMEEWAKDNRPGDADSCGWYHGTWQYLRLLDMVAVPHWHRDFYNEALGNILTTKPDANVLISACADYGMLATLHEAMELTGTHPTVTIYDICKTPLQSCHWYADRHGLTINTQCGDLLSGDMPEAPFDLIVTDEFFTVLKAEYKPLISARWKELLKPGGSVVTVAMLGGETTPELRFRYAERARQLLQAANGGFLPNMTTQQEKAVNDRFVTFAELHTRHMLTGEGEIKSLLSGFDNVTMRRITTPGECVNPTDSYQIVASLSSKQQG